VVEPSVQYAHSSTNRVSVLGLSIFPAINVGFFELSRVNRDSFIGALTARYGWTSRFEVEAKLPYVWRRDHTVGRAVGLTLLNDTLTSANGDGMGDVEFATRYQFTGGAGGWPYLVGNLRFKTRTGTSPFEVPIDPASRLESELPTGSGFYGLQPGITAIFPSDPAVFFGSLSYLWNIKRNVGGAFGEIDPGDAIGFNFGAGFALNDKASLSFAYDHSILGKNKQNGIPFPNSVVTQVGSILIGWSYRLNERSSINVNVGAGVTTDSPDLTLSLRVPYSF
jgi:hypothetical protein